MSGNTRSLIAPALKTLLACLYVLGMIMATPAGAADDRVYEFRIYTTNPGKLEALHARFRDHTLDLFEKHGIENLYYWDVTEGAEGEDTDNMMVYLVAHDSRAAADAAWQAFLADPEWQEVARKSQEDGPILTGRPASIFMQATDFSPALEAPNAGGSGPARLFELRKYNTGEEGLPGTLDRFRGFEADLFTKHNMPVLAYWQAMDQSSFIYLIAHQDRETSRANWQGFFGEFRQAMEKYNASREQSGTEPEQKAPPKRMTSEIRFLVPTDYSPRR